MIVDPFLISSDEINCLIYAYFRDSGFNHSAFTLRNEGQLQISPHFSKHIRRGELVNLLGKALLYLEVESHWRDDGLANNCKAGFSLLETHVCSSEERETPPRRMELNLKDSHLIPQSAVMSTSPPYSMPPRNGPLNSEPHSLGPLENVPSPPLNEESSQVQNETLPLAADPVTAPKISPLVVEDQLEMRPRRASTDMDIDDIDDSARAKSPVYTYYDTYNGRTVTNVDPRSQGPGDDTDLRVMQLLVGHETEVFVCAFNPKMPNLLASGSKEGIIYLWDLPDPPPLYSDEFAEPPLEEPIFMEQVAKASQGDPTSLAWNPDGTLLAVGSYDSILRVCSIKGNLYFSHPQHQGPIFAVRFSKNGTWLLTASLDGTTCLWDVEEKRLHKQYRCHKDCCLEIEWISDDIFASAGADKCIFILRVDEDEPIKTLKGHKDEVNQIRVNPSGTKLASCSDDGTARIWEVDSQSLADEDPIPGLSTPDLSGLRLKGHKHSVSTLGWCADYPPGSNELLATSSFDCTARLWDSTTGECLHVFTDHKGPIYTLNFSPDGKFLATGSGDGWLHIYQTRTQTRLWSWFAGAEKPGVFEIDWQMDGGINRIAIGLESRQVGVLDVNKLDALRPRDSQSESRDEML